MSSAICRWVWPYLADREFQPVIALVVNEDIEVVRK